MLEFASKANPDQDEERYVNKGADLANLRFHNYETFGYTTQESVLAHFVEQMEEEKETLELFRSPGPPYRPGYGSSFERLQLPKSKPSAPQNKGTGNEGKENQFIKALKGLGEIGVGIKKFVWDNQQVRGNHVWKEWENPSIDAVLATLDWLTYGIPSGFWASHVERTNRMLNSKWVVHDEKGNFTLMKNPVYHFSNTLLLGIPDMVSGAFFPEEPYSAQHWEDTIGTALLITSILGKAVDVKSKTKVAASVDELDDVVKSQGAGNLKPQTFIDELAQSGVKYSADDVVVITKTPDGKLMWLEKGNNSSGLTHITERHVTQFSDRGINDIPSFLNKALQEVPIKTGVNPQGPFADYLINGSNYRVVYGTNGYIVSFFPIK